MDFVLLFAIMAGVSYLSEKIENTKQEILDYIDGEIITSTESTSTNENEQHV